MHDPLLLAKILEKPTLLLHAIYPDILITHSTDTIHTLKHKIENNGCPKTVTNQQPSQPNNRHKPNTVWAPRV